MMQVDYHWTVIGSMDIQRISAESDEANFLE